MSKPTFQRKKYLVDQSLQLRFAGFVMVLVFSIAFITSTIVFMTVLSLLGDKLASVYPQGRLMPIIQGAYIAFGAILMITIPIIVFISIRISHRIVGPLPKIYDYLEAVGNGDYPGTLTIRTKDELKHLVASINDMAEKLQNKKLLKSK